jgi:hypothetical protein
MTARMRALPSASSGGLRATLARRLARHARADALHPRFARLLHKTRPIKTLSITNTFLTTQ